MFISVAGFLASMPASANTPGYVPPPLYDMFGQVGLVDMPTARFAPDGEMSMTFSATPTGEKYNLGFQALPWLEATFRYARVDRYNGPHADDYDRSLSLKIRLASEGRYTPAVAVGLQDMLGTGIFAGEYLNASKHIGDFDFTLGVGWRQLGGIAQFTNPFALVFKSFKSDSTSATTGIAHLGALFHGPKAGLFGGVAWQTPIDGLLLVAEASGEKYSREQAFGSIDLRTPFNFAFTYEPWDGVQIGGGYYYGSQFGFHLTFHTNAYYQQPRPRLESAPVPLVLRSPEARKNAVLQFVQDKTHFYDIYAPGGADEVSQPITNGPPQQALADVLYRKGEGHSAPFEDVETYGDSLLIQELGALPSSCARMAKIASAARDSGFKRIVLSASASAAVEICPLSGKQYAVANPIMQSSNSAHIVKVAETVEVAKPEINVAQSDGASDYISASAKTTEDIKKKIIDAVKAQKLAVAAISVTSNTIEIAFVNNTYRSEDEAAGRLLRALMASAPNNIEVFRLVSMVNQVPTLALKFNRSDIEREIKLAGDASELLPLTTITAVADDDPLITQDSLIENPTFWYSLAPDYRHSLFDPNEPYAFEIFGRLSAGVQITRNWAVTGSFEANIYNTFNTVRPSNSVLPHVRSDFPLYLKHGLNGISELQINYLTKLAPDVYARATGGILEDMYDGVGGEILWKPLHKRWALGAALFAVQQRSFDRLFGLRDYRAVTGHISVYYESPVYDLNFAMHVGRYLAGDYGATFQVTRRFASGVEIGVYATLTNVPFAKYGEGSFDKGFIIRIPLDDLVPVNTQDEINFDFTPLTRDGGQRLDGENILYRMTQRSSESEYFANWGEVLNP